MGLDRRVWKGNGERGMGGMKNFKKEYKKLRNEELATKLLTLASAISRNKQPVIGLRKESTIPLLLEVANRMNGDLTKEGAPKLQLN